MGACTASRAACQSIFDLAKAFPLAAGPPDSDAMTRIFRITHAVARCHASLELAKKYGVAQDNEQTVVSVTNKYTHAQTWFNEARTQKPQTFLAADTSLLDPLATGRTCDFCDWQNLTATDTFGRVETEHVVTASNLFKYCEPCHGVVLFKAHDPLSFAQEQVCQLLSAAAEWFRLAHEVHPTARYPLFIWNCLHRAGASQYHGHAQVCLSQVPFAADHIQQCSSDLYASEHESASYHRDLCRAHAAAGLLRTFGSADDRAHCFASLAPCKDMEIVIHGTSLLSCAFQEAVFVSLRTLVDDLASPSFNVGIQPQWGQPQCVLHAVSSLPAEFPVVARIVSRGRLDNRASDFGGLEVFGGASIGHTDPFRIVEALDRRLRPEFRFSPATFSPK